MDMPHVPHRDITSMAMGPGWLPPVLLSLMVCVYVLAALRLYRRGDRWPLSRCACAVLGAALLAAALSPPLVSSMQFPVRIVQHLDMAMAAPLALALSAPVTLALRTLPPRARRLLLRMLHSELVQAFTWAPVVVGLDIGGMYAYYLTGLFTVTDRNPWLHLFVHLHMFVAGCLLSWYLVLRDPMPRRPSTRTRLIVLFVTAGLHDLVAKLMFAHLLPPGVAPAPDIRLGAQIMFYGGDVIELALATVVLADWYRRTGRQLTHQRRRRTSGSQVLKVTG